jgi:hypothetical protein
MNDMRTAPRVIDIDAGARARARRQMRALAAAATTAAHTAAHPDATHPPVREEPPRGGRAWLNGRELGGYDRRYAHLTRAYE